MDTTYVLESLDLPSGVRIECCPMEGRGIMLRSEAAPRDVEITHDPDNPLRAHAMDSMPHLRRG